MCYSFVGCCKADVAELYLVLFCRYCSVVCYCYVAFCRAGVVVCMVMLACCEGLRRRYPGNLICLGFFVSFIQPDTQMTLSSSP